MLAPQYLGKPIESTRFALVEFRLNVMQTILRILLIAAFIVAVSWAYDIAESWFRRRHQHGRHK